MDEKMSAARSIHNKLLGDISNSLASDTAKYASVQSILLNIPSLKPCTLRDCTSFLEQLHYLETVPCFLDIGKYDKLRHLMQDSGNGNLVPLIDAAEQEINSLAGGDIASYRRKHPPKMIFH